jgi:hypothetical protein
VEWDVAPILVQILKIKLLKQKKMPVKISLKIFREEDLALEEVEEEVDEALAWDGQTVSEEAFNELSRRPYIR